MVLQSLIPRIERPELAINIPPTMESSVINSVEITALKDWRSDRSRLASKENASGNGNPNAIGGGKHHGCHEIQCGIGE